MRYDDEPTARYTNSRQKSHINQPKGSKRKQITGTGNRTQSPRMRISNVSRYTIPVCCDETGLLSIFVLWRTGASILLKNGRFVLENSVKRRKRGAIGPWGRCDWGLMMFLMDWGRAMHPIEETSNATLVLHWDGAQGHKGDFPPANHMCGHN